MVDCPPPNRPNADLRPFMASVVQFLPRPHDAQDDTGRRGRIGCRGLDDGAVVERICESDHCMTGIISMIVAIAGALLYAIVATMTSREEGWIIWCGIGLLLAALGLLGLLFYVGEKIGALNGSPKSGIARGALTVGVGTVLWLLSRIVPFSEHDYFEGIGAFLAFTGLLIVVVSLFFHARKSVV
jgi:hypothetical protein